MFNKDVETKKKVTIKKQHKKALKKVKFIENTISPGDRCTSFFKKTWCKKPGLCTWCWYKEKAK